MRISSFFAKPEVLLAAFRAFFEGQNMVTIVPNDTEVLKNQVYFVSPSFLKNSTLRMHHSSVTCRAFRQTVHQRKKVDHMLAFDRL